MGLFDKVIGKAAGAVGKVAAKGVKSFVKDATKMIEKQAPRNATAGTKVVRPSISVPTPTPIVRSTVPTRSPFIQAAAPVERPSLIIPGATRTPASIIVPPSAARNVRSAVSVEENIATRKAAEEAARAQAAQASKASAFGQPKRLLSPATPAQAPSFIQAAGTAPAAVAPAAAQGVAGAQAQAVEEAAKRGLPRFLRPALEVAGTTAPLAVSYVQDQGQNVPGFVKGAANVAAILAGGSLARRGLGKNNLLNAEVRAGIKAAPLATKAATIGKAVGLPVLGGVTAVGGIQNLFTGTQTPVTPPATALPPVGGETTVLPPLGGTPETPGFGTTAEQDAQAAINAALANISSGTGTADDAATVATGQKSALDQSVAAAMADLEAAYGGPAATDAALASGDPILAQQLAGIEADYQAGLGQIQANYAGALAQVQGYQTQADQLLQDTAAAQMSGFAAAAGGLEAMSPGTGLTGDQAAAAGISDTALGGAGITGAALSRGLAGAASVQAAADRLRLGTDLSGQLATGRLTQADLQAGLARAAVGEKAVARTESAKRDAAARELAKQQKNENAVRIAELKYQAALDKQSEAIRKSDNEAARKQRIAELKTNAELDLAMKIASMSPAERAAYKGSTSGAKNFTAPTWYGKRDSRDPNTAVQIALPSGGKVTVAAVQRAQDLLDSQLQQPEAQDPTTALAVWSDFYNKIGADALAIFAATGRPTSASAIVKQILNTPKK